MFASGSTDQSQRRMEARQPLARSTPRICADYRRQMNPRNVVRELLRMYEADHANDEDRASADHEDASLRHVITCFTVMARSGQASTHFRQPMHSASLRTAPWRPPWNATLIRVSTGIPGAGLTIRNTRAGQTLIQAASPSHRRGSTVTVKRVDVLTRIRQLQHLKSAFEGIIRPLPQKRREASP